MTPIAELRRRAAADARIELRPEEPHPGGLTIGFVALALGIWATQAGAPRWGWLALAGIVVSMLLSRLWLVRGPGWALDFAARAIEPIGPWKPGAAEAESLADPEGWAIRTAPGDGFGTVAVDLLHIDRGRVARLVERHALRRRDRHAMFRLADTLAERLGIARVGIGAGL